MTESAVATIENNLINGADKKRNTCQAIANFISNSLSNRCCYRKHYLKM